MLVIFCLLLLASFAFAQNVPALSLEEEKSLIKSAAMENSKGFKLSWLYVLFPVVIAALFIGYHEFGRKKWHMEFNAHKRQQSALALRAYVASNLKKGFKKEQIKNALIKNNYKNHEIEEAFRGME